MLRATPGRRRIRPARSGDSTIWRTDFAPPDALAALMRDDVVRWRTVVEKAGIQPD